MSERNGLEIIQGLITGLKTVVAAANTVVEKRGPNITNSDFTDPLLKGAYAGLGEDLSYALVPRREEWLQEISKRFDAVYTTRLQGTINYIARAEEYQEKLWRWDVPTIGAQSAALAKELGQLQASIRTEADAVRQKVLDLLEK